MDSSVVKKRTVLWVLISALILSTVWGIFNIASAEVKKTFSKPEDLGPVVTSVGIFDSAYGIENGHDVMYTTVRGVPGVFQVVDLDTYEVLRSYELDGLSGSWTHVVDDNGNVYIGGSGKLFKYDPISKTVSDLGTVAQGARETYGLSVDEEGRVYGGTYPNAHVFRYDPATGETKDFGSVAPGQDYVRSLAYANGTVYAGIGTTGSIVTLDPSTGETSTLAIPDRPEYYDVNNLDSIWGLDVVDHYLFVHLSNGAFLVYDLEKQEWLSETITGTKGLFMSPEHNGKTYFVANGKIMSFDLTEETFDETRLNYGSYIRHAGWVTIDDPELPGTSLATVSYNGSVQLFNFESETHKTLLPVVEGQPTSIQTMEKGPDGNLYFSGYLGTFGAQYNPSNGEINLFNLGQAEGMTPLGNKMYMGLYPGADIYEYDTSKDPELGNNPRKIFSLGSEGQDRPFAMSSGDGKLFIGTIPTYGELGGALAVYDPEGGENNNPQIYRNIVKDQSVIGLAYRDGKIYGSTSVWGGLGSDPTANQAKMFVWDVSSGEKIAEFTPELHGDIPPKAIGGLSFGPDGLLWGASYGTIFAMDPETYKVVKSREIVSTDWNFSHYWRPVHLRWGEDGVLYTTLAGQITVIDPDTLDYVQLQRSSLMTLGNDGNIYYADGANLKRITVKDGLPPKSIDINVPIDNSGFESTLVNDTIPGWGETWSSENAGYNITSERSFAGNQSLRLKDSATNETVAVLSDPVDVIEGREYTAKSQVYLDEGRTLFMLRFFDAEGNQIQSEAAYITSGRDNWQEIVVSGFAPENAKTARIYAFVSNYWMATAYYDNVSLTYKAYENELPGLEIIKPTANLVTNDSTPGVIVKTANNSVVQIMKNDKVLGEVNTIANKENTITLSQLSEGTHNVVVVAQTTKGIKGEPVPLTITVDTVVPNAPTVVSPEQPKSTNDSTPIIVVKAEVGSTVQVLEGESTVGTGKIIEEGKIVIKLNELEQGIHKLKTVAIDRAGNKSVATTVPHIIINNGVAKGHE